MTHTYSHFFGSQSSGLHQPRSDFGFHHFGGSRLPDMTAELLSNLFSLRLLDPCEHVHSSVANVASRWILLREMVHVVHH